MKPGIKYTLAAAVIMTSVALAPATAPAYIGDDGPAPIAQHMKQMAKELQLSPQQKQQIKEIFDRNKPAAEPLFKQMKTERLALRSLVQADTIDEAAIRAQSAKVAAIQADLAVQRARVHQEIRAILTPEQIAKAKELQAQRDKRMENRAHQGKRSKRVQ
ncbi:Spy/CpxP family protein refolding chaperone [Pelotalea chapellei]|uniref:Spy/CpxP family protein refolding chaperone n=1 Tax=Pelotalea chapellei TaxID=44671 RepID=A0ABS5UCU8_9BACT|nr:Spy/CpxP family protein refolding chaperone [Pelotalea chapellei]MBT1073463.1 Spy/CpxP family protein refolding chaperone [Pelotalea chapellei]